MKLLMSLVIFFALGASAYVDDLLKRINKVNGNIEKFCAEEGEPVNGAPQEGVIRRLEGTFCERDSQVAGFVVAACENVEGFQLSHCDYKARRKLQASMPPLKGFDTPPAPDFQKYKEGKALFSAYFSTENPSIVIARVDDLIKKAASEEKEKDLCLLLGKSIVHASKRWPAVLAKHCQTQHKASLQKLGVNFQ